jgi:hypothetical protein
MSISSRLSTYDMFGVGLLLGFSVDAGDYLSVEKRPRIIVGNPWCMARKWMGGILFRRRGQLCRQKAAAGRKGNNPAFHNVDTFQSLRNSDHYYPTIFLHFVRRKFIIR